MEGYERLGEVESLENIHKSNDGKNKHGNCTTYSTSNNQYQDGNYKSKDQHVLNQYLKIIICSVVLVCCGAAFLITSIVIAFLPKKEDGPDTIVFAIAGMACFLPGVYQAGYIYNIHRGHAGYKIQDLGYDSD